MRTCGYLYRMLDNWYHSIGIINKGWDENTITYIIKFVLNASSNLNGELGNADVLAANKVFKTTDAVIYSMFLFDLIYRRKWGKQF